MNGEIIAVGTELLLGNIVNTNAQFLSEELSALGIDVYYQTVVGDNPQRLENAVRTAFERADLIILSGGLGPTDDDLTKETVSACLNLELHLDEESAQNIKKYLRQNISKSNLKQAYIPEGAIILKNGCGTAPGVIIEKDGKTAVLLPGPPGELKPMFNESVKPYLKEKSDSLMSSRILRLFGMGESRIGETVADLMQSPNPTVAPYAKENETTLRITAKADSQQFADIMLDDMIKKIKERLGDYIYSYNNTELKEVTAACLIDSGITIAVAESCTAGLFCATLADTPGISAVLAEGVITYSNEAKVKYLGVSEDTLKEYGAVSEQTAREMACGIKKRASTRMGVSITGIAGPDGGTEEKPVGLVYIGIAFDEDINVMELRLFGSRRKIRHAAVMNALSQVRKTVLEKTV